MEATGIWNIPRINWTTGPLQDKARVRILPAAAQIPEHVVCNGRSQFSFS